MAVPRLDSRYSEDGARAGRSVVKHNWLVMLVAIFSLAVGCCRAAETHMTHMAKKTRSDPTLWVVEPRKLWGDYGDVLISGYARRETDDGPLSLHRTGPFLPPISFPWITNKAGRAVVVSAEFKKQLESLNPPGILFREAGKSRIIPLAWEKWDLGASDPAKYPDESEPENYVWEKKHNMACAAKMSAAYELVPSVGPVDVDPVEDPRGGYLDEFTAAAIPGDVPSIARSHPTHGKVVVDNQMKAWLEKHAGEWVRFSPVRPAKAGRSAAG